MKRREFVKDLLLAGGALACGPGFEPAGAMPPSLKAVKRVLVAFSCHLDVGFTNTQAAVIAKYFGQYYPAAMKTATALRQSSQDRYIWSTGSWLLYEYLEQVSGAARSSRGTGN